MASEKQPSVSPESNGQAERLSSPSPTGLRHRPTIRTSINSKEGELRRRRSSLFSDGLSETHRSFRTSTDDLLLPRINTISTHEDQIETSHWHSVPLGLALLPAVGGLFFKDGSAVVTDVTLLGLAAILLNWALRLPWEWYKAAQATITLDGPALDPFSVVEEEEDDETLGTTAEGTTNGVNRRLPDARTRVYAGQIDDEEIQAAQQELRLHEMLALSACFGFPLLGAWLLHAVRSQLSRPSEGLVSNYNLTIFLLVAEMRPLSHLIKLVQRRTLFLQRKVNSRALEEQQVEEKQDLEVMVKRLEELEAHIANTPAAPSIPNSVQSTSPDILISKAASQASADLRKAFQPELDALNRAMRRYEKRMTISAIQVESRLQDLETKFKDVVVLAAAAQRNADKQPRSYFAILINWLCGIVVIPMQYFYRILSLPGKLIQKILNWLKTLLKLNRRSELRDVKVSQRSSSQRTRGAPKKPKSAA